jgi:hypothetical protein
VREWYSTGNPFGTGRKLAWQINRDVGERTICQSLPLNQSGTTEANPNLQEDTDIAVTIYNKNIFGLAVTVYRYYNGGEVHPQANVIGPWSSHTFTAPWSVGQHTPTTTNVPTALPLSRPTGTAMVASDSSTGPPLEAARTGTALCTLGLSQVSTSTCTAPSKTRMTCGGSTSRA